MKNRVIVFILVLLLIFPLSVKALSDEYVDIVSSITGDEIEEDKINLYLFHGAECPHCAEEREWLDGITDEYKDYLNVYMYEVWHNNENAVMMEKVGKELGINATSVPFTIIGDKYFIGFSDATASRIENTIDEYINLENNNEVNIPILGKIDMKNVSIPLVAVILGFIDGFNPCAMWVLLFLINLLLNMKDKKKRWGLGITFLLTSGLVYFLSMLGINFIIGVVTIKWLKILIALFIIIAGIFNFRKYLKIRKEVAGCQVVDDKKRKKLITRIRKIIDSKGFVLSIIGIISLAVSVNLIELACSLGFPVIFSEILYLNDISGLEKIIYLFIYIIFYLIDDMVVFVISMVTLEATGITNKYNKLCTLVSSIIMIIMGLLMLFKPDWLMLNF